MSAEFLRRAASLMRERADAAEATGAQWTGQHYWVTDYDPSDPSGQTAMQRLVGGMDAPDCDHYSSWHPAVALAVADFMESAAEHAKAIETGELLSSPHQFWINHALTIARAYLGSDA